MIQYPFTAIVGMERAKKSLIYHAIDPRIGGTLFMGHRGCAKSTLVRAFAELLKAVSDGEAPFVEVPLGTSEDRLLGSVNAQALVEKGKWLGHTGLIEQANGGVLYIDEVNLLPDQLADFILDSAASGRYRMERDGITRTVESRYILVGTMNPEEGDLRPQLSDRFAHGILVEDEFTPEERMKIVQQRIEFDDDPEAFVAAQHSAISELVECVTAARERVKSVHISPEHRLAVARKGEALKLEGMRAELAVVRTARCAAAWARRLEVTDADLEEAWAFCLGHRQPSQSRQAPPPPPSTAPRNGTPSTQQPLPATPEAPRESHRTAISIRPTNQPADQRIAEWLARPGQNGSGPSSKISEGLSKVADGGIDWIASVVHSTKAGWRSGSGAAIQLLRRVSAKRKSFWCFLDASRSTGMRNFLGGARDTLASITAYSRFRRYHLLILRDNRVHWLARNASAAAWRKSLESLTEASGKSLISQSLKAMHRSILNKGSTPSDRVLLCSDGLASPLPGETAVHAQNGLRRRLEGLTRTGTRIGWLHPAAKRGLGGHFVKLCRSLTIELFEISSPVEKSRELPISHANSRLKC